MNNSLGLIISVDKVSTENEVFINKLVNSITTQKNGSFDEILVVGVKGDKTKLSTLFKSIKADILIDETEECNNQSRFNLGLSKVKTKYVSFITHESQMTENYIKLAKEYLTKTKQKVVGVLPLELRSVVESESVIGMTNEVVWVNIVNEFGNGILSKELVSDYHSNISIAGLVVETEVMKIIGGFKTKLKFGYINEFLLRLTKLGGNLRIIPKIGVKRIVDMKTDENVLLENMSYDEVDFWMEKAIESSVLTEDKPFVFKQDETDVRES